MSGQDIFLKVGRIPTCLSANGSNLTGSKSGACERYWRGESGW